MLTRRGFAGFASCAICSLTGFLATDAGAQTPPAATPGVKRKVLGQTDGPAPGYVTITAEVEIEPGVMVGRHTHPGIESGYVVEGEIELPIEGQPTRVLKAGDGFQVPAGVPHAGSRSGTKPVRLVSTYIVEKGKPLASPA
ncbi:cupin domain-containing protein [Methylobacterium platani]|uniref:Cupin n=2 Tax=Methylobacterium platani TaxID=427683 RepID=A0A179S8X2_9HYPH|nr:cupin domain-containing protein [Methylobacterium platani]KMO11583.1 cupin [Methylobacterium platani JCM 14648]OAS24193.1 cupin [Methylobacterium platani]